MGRQNILNWNAETQKFTQKREQIYAWYILCTIQNIKFLRRIKWIHQYERHLNYAQYLDPTAWIVDMFQFGVSRQSTARHSGACHT